MGDKLVDEDSCTVNGAIDDIDDKSDTHYMERVIMQHCFPGGLCVPSLVGLTPNDVVLIWEKIKPVIEVLELTTPPTIAIIKMVWRTKNKDNKNAKEVFGDLIKQDCWTLNEISEIYGLNKNDSKELLKWYKYKWDKNKRAYVSTIDKDKVEKLLRKSNKLKIK